MIHQFLIALDNWGNAHSEALAISFFVFLLVFIASEVGAWLKHISSDYPTPSQARLYKETERRILRTHEIRRSKAEHIWDDDAQPFLLDDDPSGRDAA